MAKKKDKSQVINNIQELNLEIDYDKLAEAIVKAQEKSNLNNSDDDKKRILFFRKVGYILANKTPNGTVSFTDLLAGVMQLLFNILSVILLSLGILCFADIFIVIFENQEWQFIYYYIMGTILLPLIALITRGVANEIGREKDKNYIIAAFSGIVSFAALIVALIALFKGVG